MFSVEQHDAIAVVRVGGQESLDEVGEAFGRLGRDEGVRAIILAWAGGQSFGARAGEAAREVCGLIESSRVPVIAAVSGEASGPGLELIRACHIRIAAKGAAASGYEDQPAGFLNRVVEPERLMDEALELAREISVLAPLAIAACLQAVTRGLRLPIEEGLRLETELFGGLFATDDMREGTLAFLEKRPPAFKGR